jgi:hypothetical protein
VIHQRSTFAGQNINDRNKLTMRIILFLLFITAAAYGWGQIFSNPITGTNPNTSNPYTIGQTVDPNISVSGISRGAGITGANANNRYNANSWNTATIDLTAYFEFTLTPNATFCLNFTNFIYTGQASGTGATSFALRSSLDGFTANIGTPNATGTTIDLSSASYQNLTGAVTFRFYGWGASASAGTFSINSFIFSGSTSCGSSNTITTTAVATSPFVLTCNSSATGNVDFTTTGTFNLGNIFTAELSDAAGSFSSPTAIGTLTGASAEGLNPSGTIPFTIPLGTVPGSLYRIRVVSDDPLTIGSDNGFDLTITNNCTITTGTTSSSSFSVSCASGTSGSIDFTSSSTMLAGNIYTAELSNSAGSFAAPVSIGTLSSTANTGTINITIPAATATGAGYLIRITASDPATTGSSSTPFTITLTDGPCTLEPPHLTSVIINSCDGSCSEGDNELVFGTSGDYSFDVNTSNFDFRYGATFPGTNYTDALVNNTTRINELNTAAGCGSLFVDANGGNVPANANWMLASTNLCDEALTWSGLCGLGPIYVIFQNDSDWNSGGNFANNPSTPGTRFYRTSITTTLGSTFTIDYTTDGSYPNSDGVFASFDADGGAAISYGDDNCILQPVLLPTGLLSYNGKLINGQSLLTWQTNSEQNNDYFTIAHSTSGYDFEVLGQVQGAGNSSTLNDYQLIHSRPAQGINYYKLTSTDFDGTTYTKGIVSLLFNSNGCYFDAQTSEIKFNEHSDYRIFSMDGKLLGEVINETSLLFNQRGIVLIQDLRTGLTERLFVP